MSKQESKIITREELYELIWSKPAIKLAKELVISDVGLGKICKRMEIPKPTLGYWRKVEVGRGIPRKPKLKPLSPKGQATVTITPPAPESLAMKNIRKAEHIPFPDSLVNPRRLTKRSLASFNKAKTDKRGILISRNKIHLDIHVTQESLDRACLIMDTLIKEMESRGIKLLTTGERPLKTIVEVGGESIEISLDEKTRRLDHKPTAEEKENYKEHYWMIPRYDHLPTGDLSLKIHDWHAPRKVWYDGKRQRLERCLGSFIQGLRETASQIKVAREQHRLNEIRWEEERKLRAERERLAQIENRKAEKLMADASSWQQAEQCCSACKIDPLEGQISVQF